MLSVWRSVSPIGIYDSIVSCCKQHWTLTAATTDIEDWHLPPPTAYSELFHRDPSASTVAMEAIVANVDDIVFDIEVTLREQLGAQSLPFPGMDSEYSWQLSCPTSST